MTRVLVAIDLGEGSDEALRQASAWTARAKGKLGLLHVTPDLAVTSVLFPHQTEPAALRSAELEARIAEHLERTAREAGAQDFEIFVDVGDAKERILERARAWGAELVVVGSHGHAGLERTARATSATSRSAAWPSA